MAYSDQYLEPVPKEEGPYSARYLVGGMLKATSAREAGKSWLDVGKGILELDKRIGERFGEGVIEATAPVSWQRPRNAPMMPESVRAGLATAASQFTPLNVMGLGLPAVIRLGQKLAGVTKPRGFVEEFLKTVREEPTVALYRGEGVPSSEIPAWVKQSPSYQKVQRDVQGRWFTDDPAIAKWYAKEAGTGGRVILMRVPKSVAEEFKVTKNPDALKFSRDPEREYFVSPEFSQRAREGGPTRPPPPGGGWFGEPPRGGPPAIRQPREVGPPEAGQWIDPNRYSWERTKLAIKEKLPADYWIATKVPESAVIGDVDRVRAGYTTFLDDLLTGPLNKTIQRYSADDWMSFEHQAVSYWREHGRTPEAVGEAIGQLPEDAQSIFKFFQQRLVDEQHARQLLGLEDISEFPGPYLPRIAAQDWKNVIRVYQEGAPLAQDLRTTLGSFQRGRVYETYTEGQLGLLPDGTVATPTLYENPQKAILMRMAASEKLLRTAEMMDNLSAHGVLHGTPEAAAQVAVRRPHGQVTEVRGLPGTTTQKWYAPSREEALFLQQNLTVPEFRGGRWASLMHTTNQLFRNPNLYNPAPHIVKNMGAKYLIATVNIGGNPARLLPDAVEYLKGLNPQMIAEFDAAMPFAKTGKTPYEMLYPYLKTQPHQKVAQWLSYVSNNRISSQVIFAHADPAMKYSLWKQYRAKGLSSTAAANQVTVDLVRYAVRSELTDIWKSVPLNFFVPWRTGSIMAITKQFGREPFKTLGVGAPYWAMTRPFRTVLLLGTIDYLRDQHYRDTGRTFHMPIDYYQGPMAKIWDDPKQAANLVASLAALGPGGNLERLLKQALTTYEIAVGKEDKARLQEMFWGLSQIYGATDEMYKYTQDGKGEHLWNVMTAALLAEYPTGGRKPERLITHLGLEPTAPDVQAQQAQYQLRKAKRELFEEQLRMYRETRRGAQPSLYDRLRELVR